MPLQIAAGHSSFLFEIEIKSDRQLIVSIAIVCWQVCVHRIMSIKWKPRAKTIIQLFRDNNNDTYYFAFNSW